MAQVLRLLQTPAPPLPVVLPLLKSRRNVMFSKLVDMENDDDDQLDGLASFPGVRADYPYGLRICLTGKELEKLGLEVPDTGDMIDMRCFGTVTSVSTSDDSGGKSCRVEIQIEKIAVENKMEE